MSQILDNYSFETAEAQVAARKFFAKVYAFMFGALLVSAAIAYQYGNETFVNSYFMQLTAKGLRPTGLFYVVVFSPLGVALIMQRFIDRLSLAALIGLYALYSVLIGFSLSTLLIHYTTQSIAITFGITAGTFGTMAVMGYVTKVDLTKFGSILMMAFFGIFIASLVNMFVGSEALQYAISIIGVLVFTGLTAYHMQKLKEFAFNAQASEEEKNKMALLGGFTLYVLFVNLFLMLLNLFGSRD